MLHVFFTFQWGCGAYLTPYGVDGPPLPIDEKKSSQCTRCPTYLAARLAESKEFYAEAENRKKTRELFIDISVKGDRLLAPVYSHEPPYKILEFKLSEQRIEFVKTMLVAEQAMFFRTFTHSDDRIYVFDGWQNAIRMYREKTD